MKFQSSTLKAFLLSAVIAPWPSDAMDESPSLRGMLNQKSANRVLMPISSSSTTTTTTTTTSDGCYSSPKEDCTGVVVICGENEEPGCCPSKENLKHWDDSTEDCTLLVAETPSPSSPPSCINNEIKSNDFHCGLCPSNGLVLEESTNMEVKVSEHLQDDCPEHDIRCWDTSKVTDMSFAFTSHYEFNGNLECWDTASATTMEGMFAGASSFNQPLQNWNLSKVKSTAGMFKSASSFNQPLEDWDVSEVIDMDSMFFRTLRFNQPLEKWNVSKVSHMIEMFDSSSKFNQCLSTWAGKTPDTVSTDAMIKDSKCPNETADPVTGPWCQGADQGCSVSPTDAPSEVPTSTPTDAPSEVPTLAPTKAPTNAPSAFPTNVPSEVPSSTPTEAPTDAPTAVPTVTPTAKNQKSQKSTKSSKSSK